MRTGIFGGTFNPVHNGHLRLAQTYIDALSLDRLLVIPTRIPPHKADNDLVDGIHRLEMCRLAFADSAVCHVSDMEVKRPEKSYTVDTLETLKKAYPRDELFLIMGSDMFLTLTEWRNWERIFALAVMCVGERSKDLHEKLLSHGKYLESLGAQCRIVDLTPLPISSTMVRERIRRREEFRSLVPSAVADYIEENHLYL